MHPKGKIGDPGVEVVVRLACRREGVTIPDVQDYFGVTRWCAVRFMQRLEREDKVYRTEQTRRRTEVYGARGPGRPCAVYRARVKARRWVSSLSLQARRNSRDQSLSRIRKEGRARSTT